MGSAQSLLIIPEIGQPPPLSVRGADINQRYYPNINEGE